MRKAQKKQIEELITLMAEAQAEIKNAIRNKNVPLALDLLEQCQQAAIQVGTSIDALEGEGHPVVTLLEQYCELVYKLHEELASGALKAGNDAATYAERVLNGSWTQINKGVEEDIPARLEVVFCPYKASMWDSLESVWKAADEDPNCTAYVIPIPYFDKMPNGAFAEEHYEGLEYPEYVPITYYKSYNFEERRPDIVFIHNPYDENNFVTTVHPFYYASNLVKYTDKLVYIPYFVLGEPDWDTMSDEGKEKMRMFCVQPGVLSSHKTIVQSEAMKKVYVETLCNEFGEQYRPMWEDKILGLGSPKFDKAVNTTADDITVPEEWKPVLYDADGCMKKVILYNTSVSALLEHEDKMIAKMRRVFETFYENRDEVALLWRPHPLIKATIESMRPKLWTEYEKLVNEYKEASWGIYDDTADLNRALELADAYYGDRSSLVQLCQEKGMIITIQDVETEDTDGACDVDKLNFALYYEMLNTKYYDGSLYFFSHNTNDFMRVDLTSGQVEIVEKLSNEKNSNALFGEISEYEQFFIGAPNWASHAYMYDIKQKKMMQVTNDEEIGEGGIKAGNAIKKGKKIFYLPFSEGNHIWCLDIDKKSMYKGTDIKNIFLKKTGDVMEAWSFTNVYEYRGLSYTAVRKQEYIVEFNIEKEEYSFYKVCGAKILQLIGVENKLYFLTEDKKIICWNIETKQVEEKKEVDIKENSVETLSATLCIDEVLYFFGKAWTLNLNKKDFGVKYDIKTGEMKSFSYQEEFKTTPKHGEMYSFSSMDKNRNIYFVSSHKNIHIFNYNTKQARTIKMQNNEKVKKKKDNGIKKTIGRVCLESVIN